MQGPHYSLLTTYYLLLTTADTTHYSLLTTYYSLLLTAQVQGPSGATQYELENRILVAPAANGSGTQNVMMLPSDWSLTKDPEYKVIVAEFAASQAKLDTAFSHAWYATLGTRDLNLVRPESQRSGTAVWENHRDHALPVHTR